jgi:predicted kinase
VTAGREVQPLIHEIRDNDLASTRVVHTVPTFVAAAATDLRPCVGMLIVLSGLPATGKTVLAAAVARGLGVVLLSVDPVDSALAAEGVRESGSAGRAAYAVVGAMAEQNLALGTTVVVDAVNAVGEAKTFWIELARRRGARLLAVETILSDRVLHRERLSGRVRELAIAEPTWEAVILRRDEWVAWPFAALVVDSAEPLEDNLTRVLEAARTIIAERPDRDATADRGAPGSDQPADERGAAEAAERDNKTPEGTSGP